MSLIICSECGKEYSDHASVCPNCACPTPSANGAADKPATKARHPFRLILFMVIIIALLAVAVRYIRRDYLYNSGLNAMQNGDYSMARNCLEELYYKDSELILNDVSFLKDLEEIVKKEISYDFEMEYIINSAEDNLKKLRKYKAVEFYTDGLDKAIDQYIEGLERIIGALDNEVTAAIQYELLAGKYYCDFVVVALHDGIGFLQNSSRYAEMYNGIISEEEAMLTAYEELDEKGHVTAQDGEFLYSQVRLYLKNDTEYSFDQAYIFNFYEYNGSKLLDTVTVDVLGIDPHSEYTVCIDVPKSATNGYSVDYSYYYLNIDIPD